jgi:hypothetical protein
MSDHRTSEATGTGHCDHCYQQGRVDGRRAELQRSRTRQAQLDPRPRPPLFPPLAALDDPQADAKARAAYQARWDAEQRRYEANLAEWEQRHAVTHHSGRPEWSGSYFLDAKDAEQSIQIALLDGATTRDEVLEWLAYNLDQRFGECQAGRISEWCKRSTGLTFKALRAQTDAQFRGHSAYSHPANEGG